MTKKQTFKVGDEVRVIKPHFRFNIGHTFKVADIDDVGDLFDERRTCVHPHKVELVAQQSTKEETQVTTFKVGDKVRILGLSIFDADHRGKNGKVKRERYVDHVSEVCVSVKVDGKVRIYRKKDIELASNKPTKKQRLSELERQVAELQAEVASLKEAQKPTITFLESSLSIAKDTDIDEIASKIAEAIAKERNPWKKPKLTPNEQRKAIIAEAKAFVAKHTTPNTCDDEWKVKCAILYEGFGVIPNFHVNTEKRTVALILNGASSGTVRGKFFAKCAPDDVFNADIGKAIALGRALGLDVERFEQAVKPTELVVGHNVKGKHGVGGGVITSVKDGKAFVSNRGGYWKTEIKRSSHLTLVDDTEAQY